jgi:hypothetical protein
VVAQNNTGRPERVLPPGAGGNSYRSLGRINGVDRIEPAMNKPAALICDFGRSSARVVADEDDVRDTFATLIPSASFTFTPVSTDVQHRFGLPLPRVGKGGFHLVGGWPALAPSTRCPKRQHRPAVWAGR